ncbi:EAL domain-containing protein [Butyrivibrio sp. NC3005]|uniref:EAL domain-containing protein n=1 Tax=Butyrivibrio sp. NC3005 TaxID=1280685 RepID=UPI00041024D6|nr:EAL domain-containing protein [Butyrivibrio sp. NC3005]
MKYDFIKIHNRIIWKFFKRLFAIFVVVFLCGVTLFPLYTMAYASDTNEIVSNIKLDDKGNKIVRVGWYEASYNYTDRFGRRTGIAYEYQEKILTHTKWKYEYVEGTWPELLQMLLNGEIDLLSDVSYTKERSQKLLYPSLPMGTESYYIYVNKKNATLMDDDIQFFNGKKFAVNKGSIQEKLLKEWSKNHGINIDLIEISNLDAEETINLLKNGIIDAYVSLDTYGRSEFCQPVYKFGSSDYYFAVNKERSDLLADLEHALIAIQNEDPFYNQRLYQKYIWTFNTGVIFRKEEKEWLEKKHTIKVGYRNDYEPFCFESEGKVSGALKELLERASKCVEGIDINYEAYPYDSTKEAIKALNEGEIDVVFPISMGIYDSEQNNIYISNPIMSTEIYALVKTGEQKDIFSSENTKVVLLEGNVNFDNFVKEFFPDWEISWRNTLEEVYSAVGSGEADCAMVNGYRINTNDRLRRENNLSILDTGEEIRFSFAVSRDNNILLSILNKTEALMEETSVDAMLSKYTNAVNKVSFSDYVQDNLADAVAVSAILICLLLFLLLARMKAEKRALERQKLIDATERDSLTRLYTRNFFFEYANRMYKENPYNKMDAIVINIEQFHVVNAIYGWDFGDKVLTNLALDIKKFITENDGIACRAQADRFNIYFKHFDDYQQIFDRFQKCLDECTPNVNILLRMGVMPWQSGIEPVQLFDRARAACNMTRNIHHSRLMVFNEEMRVKEILEQRLLNDLKKGIENKEFIVYYQPKYNVQEDVPMLCSAEALIRWNHHELGMVPPDEFITLFEKKYQIGMLDRYIWTEVARQIAVWKEKYGRTIPISVNLSRVDIFDPNLDKTIEGIVTETGIGRENLHLEITESAYTEGEEQILDVIDRFRSKGYHIEMDDFGTGYSSLNLLTHMSIDVLKLDRSFIKDIEFDDDSKNVRMVELILDIAKSLKLIVVAEGVETKEQLDFLKGRGCDLVQGYYFSKPLPADEFEKKAFNIVH